MNKNRRVVIIGAGPAGIAAAAKLLENGLTDVTILEAENRIGGRVYTTKLGKYLVDLGGQWVHGEKDNVAFDLAHPYGLLDRTDKPRMEHEFLDSVGNPLSENIRKKITNFYRKYIINESDIKTTYESVGEYLEKMFDEEFKDDPEILKDRRKYLNSYELAVQAGDSANSWFNMSTTNFWKECEGDQMINWKDQGYSIILDILMKRYPDAKKELPVMKNTILNSEVKSIDYKSENGEVKVTTSDGRTFVADHVIVTVPLGVLKAHHNTLFNPPLPDDKINAIKGIGYGSVAKIYLLYNKPFWKVDEGKVLQHVFMWNDAERKYIEADPEKSWLLGLATATSVEHKPNLLELWISKHAKAMEAQPEEKVLGHCVEAISHFLGKKYNVTKPIAMLRTMWFSNPHFLGTYSYRCVETQRKNISRDKVEEPIQDSKILFAGEATSEHRFATVDGAITSGWKAADRILKHYNIPSTVKNA